MLTKISHSDILLNISSAKRSDVCLLRLVVRTSGFHPDNRRSIRLGDVSLVRTSYKAFFLPENWWVEQIGNL